jgi:hypothetical protein
LADHSAGAEEKNPHVFIRAGPLAHGRGSEWLEPDWNFPMRKYEPATPSLAVVLDGLLLPYGTAGARSVVEKRAAGGLVVCF